MNRDDHVADDDNGEGDDEENVVDVGPVLGVEDGVGGVRQIDVTEIGRHILAGHS